MDKQPSVSGEKPRALFVSPEAPYPLIGGGPMRTASLLQFLAHRYAVDAILFHHPGDPPPASAIPPGTLSAADTVELPFHGRNALARVARNFSRVIRDAPPLVDRFAVFPKEIAAIVANRQYDVAVIEHFWAAPYLEQIRPHAKRVILDLHNIESAWHETTAATSTGVMGWAMRRFATASVALERKWLPQFDIILVASSADAARVRIIAPDAKIIVYPNALPETAAPPLQEREEIVFSGNLQYPPNVAAVQFFAQQVWPALHNRWPNLRWKIVGKHPEAVRKLVHHDSSILLTGFVDDAIAALSEARVAVVPVLSGSGTRVKILEAWAAATPVVSTTIGAEGLDARNGEHILIADSPESFVDAVSLLLESPRDRLRIGRAGRDLFQQHYTWPAAWRTVDNIF